MKRFPTRSNAVRTISALLHQASAGNLSSFGGSTAQCLHRIDAGGAAGGKDTGYKRDGDHHD